MANQPTGATDLSRSVHIRTQKLRSGQLVEAPDVVATEEPLEIRIVAPSELSAVPASTRVSVTMRTPGNDFELAAGFLFTEGILASPEDIAEIQYATDLPDDQRGNVVNVVLAPSVFFDPTGLQRNFYTTSSCGVCGKGSLEALVVQGCTPPTGRTELVAADTLCRLPETLRQAQNVFDETGGLHAAGLFDSEGALLALHEDVGRHNALDKLVGGRFLAGEVPLSERLLLVSGRTSFELLQKAAMAGLPVVAGVGAPSSLAVDTARAFGVTLIGFLKRDTFNIYSAPQRVHVHD